MSSSKDIVQWICIVLMTISFIGIILALGCGSVYRVPHTALQTFPEEKKQKYLVLRNYNPDGGFFWQVYNVLNMLEAAERIGAVPVVYFDTGLYLEDRPGYARPSTWTGSWFDDFFEPLSTTPLPPSNIPMLESLKEEDKEEEEEEWQEFGRQGLALVRPLSLADFHRLVRRYLRPRKEILEQVVELLPKHAPHLVGVHFRGTDKLPGRTSEDQPEHPPYEWVVEQVQKQLLPGSAVIVASDEQPFIDFIRESLPDREVVAQEDAIRANVSTSGFDASSTKGCTKGDTSSVACQRYTELIQESVHRGMPEANRYLKGREVLVDALLLAQCDVFLRSRGNVSNFVRYSNPDAKMVDLAKEWRKR